MINILSYVGMSSQGEVCLWTLLGVLRTIFDATLFKVNANLKQVWQMSMPAELSKSVQRVIRTVISGVMLVQCFTVYLYLATYIVLLYPVFLEERPVLVLPWLLLAAVRNLLCELTSLALGLGTCLLLGPARPPCIKFLIMKISSITPAFYMWLLVLSYYQNLKLVESFKRFPSSLGHNIYRDYGLELAVRRRRTKSLQGEEQVRSKIKATWYRDRATSFSMSRSYPKIDQPPTNARTEISRDEDIQPFSNPLLQPIPSISNKRSESGSHEFWLGNEIVIPRDTDRILEQFVLMMIRVSIYLKSDGSQRMFSDTKFLNSSVVVPTLPDESDTPPLVGSMEKRTAPYLRDYPQIFKKKITEMPTMQSTPEVSTKMTKNITKYDSDNSIDSSRLKTTYNVGPTVSHENERQNSKKSSFLDSMSETKMIKNMVPQTQTQKSIKSSDESLNQVIEKMRKRISENKNFEIKKSIRNVGNTSAENKRKEVAERRKLYSKTLGTNTNYKTSKPHESQSSNKESKKEK